jgi:hypothetical protein
MCSPQDEDDAQLLGDTFYSYYAYGTQVFKQPLACYEESSADGEASETPHFQQIECVPAAAPLEQDDQYYAQLSYYESSLDLEAANAGKN